MANSIETYLVDSFTDEPFKGNPAGVCLPERAMQEERMLSIAKELGLSETAFVLKSDQVQKYHIRYFSPKMEIPLCGHATLASAKVLFERDADLQQIRFVTIQNLDLIIKREGELIQMEFPVYDTKPADVPLALLKALGLESVINSAFNEETNILLIEIEDSGQLIGLKPNFSDLIRSHNSINGVVVTAASKRAHYDFESRYFWPWSGTNEDPVTGGTHTFLTKYWSERLGKKKMNSFQCSERTGFMEVELLADNKLSIKSSAQIILKGELRL